MVQIAPWAVFGIALISAAAWRNEIAAAIRNAISVIKQAVDCTPVGKPMIAIVALLLWIMAIAPPRDGDVMHYHLAHIRQIIRDGGWVSLPEVHYALPFGWSLNYLPFELLRLPQAAGLVSAVLWWIVFGVLLSGTKDRMPAALKLPVCLLFLAHPFVLRIFSSAFIDAYAILLVALIAALVQKIDTLESRAVALLGFLAWIGIQSRYQLVAIGIATSIVTGAHFVRRHEWKSIRSFAFGSFAAFVLASPFYIANLSFFGNPVWPLLIGRDGRQSSYADEVAAGFISTVEWPRTIASFSRAIRLLFFDPSMFPIPIAVIGTICLALFLAPRSGQRVAAVGAGFIVLWAAMTPRLYPTHMLPLVALGPILLGSLSEKYQMSRWLSAKVVRVAVIGVFALSIVAAGTSWDYVRYTFDGNSDQFHRFTWYYPVYKWANAYASEQSRFLVVVRSGQTYYLDRHYRTADP
jgi:hypothetical protein